MKFKRLKHLLLNNNVLPNPNPKSLFFTKEKEELGFYELVYHNGMNLKQRLLRKHTLMQRLIPAYKTSIEFGFFNEIKNNRNGFYKYQLQRLLSPF